MQTFLRVLLVVFVASSAAFACNEACSVNGDCTDGSCPLCNCFTECINCNTTGYGEGDCGLVTPPCSWNGSSCVNGTGVPEFPRYYFLTLVGGGMTLLGLSLVVRRARTSRVK